MSLKFKFGKGAGKNFSGHLGTLSAELNEEHRNVKISKFVKALSKQLKIVNGEITVVSIEFACAKAKKE